PPQGIKLSFWGQAAANTYKNEISVLHRLSHARKVVLVLRIGMNDRHVKAERFQIGFRKSRKRDFGLVFVVADQHDDFPPIAAEAKRLAAEKIDAGNRWADEFFDVLDNQLRAGEMVHVRPLRRVV